MAKINLRSIFIREESIAGLEVSDTHVRLALLGMEHDAKKGKKATSPNISVLAEESLPSGAVVSGIVQKKVEVTAALQKLLKNARTPINYVIVSLPADAVYSRVFSFPRTIQREKLEEAMKLTVGFQLPVKTEDVYLDWEQLSSSMSSGADGVASEVFLASVPKSVIAQYLAVLQTVRLKPVAIEFHPLSFARAIRLAGNERVLITTANGSNTLVCVMEGGMPRFSRVLPGAFSTEEMRVSEIRKVRDFYESERGPIARVFDMKEAAIREPFASHPEIQKEPGKWLVSVGAALRGLIPRFQDSMISLLPVGTEKAYEYQKAVSFSEFLSNVTIGLSVFFVLVFAGAWMFMMSVHRATLSQVQRISSLPAPPDAVALEEKAVRLNQLTHIGGELLKKIPRWSVFFEQVTSATGEGIFIKSISLTSPEETVTINGLAQGRNQLNGFKKALEESSFFSDVSFPLANLGLKENIPFSVPVKVRDPQMLYSFE